MRSIFCSAENNATFIDGEGIVRKVELRGRALEEAVAELVQENLAKQIE
ncbi:hypothetical protein J4G07_19320 [Candidatus Poribacteria bacterium]|nr:hypothetical protein [Candidatus Poribacteria bacterium]